MYLPGEAVPQEPSTGLEHVAVADGLLLTVKGKVIIILNLLIMF